MMILLENSIMPCVAIVSDSVAVPNWSKCYNFVNIVVQGCKRISSFIIIPMILKMIILITHEETTLRATDGQVLDDSKNTKVTKEDG